MVSSFRSCFTLPSLWFNGSLSSKTHWSSNIFASTSRFSEVCCRGLHWSLKMPITRQACLVYCDCFGFGEFLEDDPRPGRLQDLCHRLWLAEQLRHMHVYICSQQHRAGRACIVKPTSLTLKRCLHLKQSRATEGGKKHRHLVVLFLPIFGFF